MIRLYGRSAHTFGGYRSWRLTFVQDLLRCLNMARAVTGVPQHAAASNYVRDCAR